MTKRFSLGQVVATRGIVNLYDDLELSRLLSRHITGDWGDLSKEDKTLNDLALISKDNRLFSAYNTPKGKVWIITEYDRSYTTILLPEEY